MTISAFPSGPYFTNAYVVSCPETKQAAIVDPAPGSAESIVSYISKYHLIPKKILITHSHWDHIADVSKLLALYDIPVWIHAEDAPNLEKPGSDRLPFRMNIPGVRPTGFLTDGQVVEVGNLKFKVIHTPGHTPGGVCFYCKEHRLLLSGDTIFKGTIGSLAFPTARPELMWDALKKLAVLPKDTLVYSGHGPCTTIGAESWLDNAEEIFGHS